MRTRVQDQRHVGIVRDDLCHHRDDFGRTEHAHLERRHRHVLEHAARLVGDPVRIDRRKDSTPAVSWTVSARDHGQGIATHAREREQVGLQPAPLVGSLAANVSTTGREKAGSVMGKTRGAARGYT
jgi:hypothetical protein